MMTGFFWSVCFLLIFVGNRHIMKKILVIIVFALTCSIAHAEFPKGYKEKTAKLAENLVKCSKEGNYNKTYNALRKIQKYEYRLQKDELIVFYSDIHEVVAAACDRQGIDEKGKNEMKVIIDALFSDELKTAVNNSHE